MIGFQVLSRPERMPAPEIVDQFKTFSSSNVADALGRFHTMTGIAHVNNPGTHLAGVALTVRTASGDNLMIHKAIDIARPGDVIVVESDGSISRALIGELMCLTARKNGVAGFVIDGAIRDAEDIRQMGFPVFAKGKNPAGPFKEGPGEIYVPISCGGTPVRTGDIILGDDDGLVVIPQELAEQVIRRTEQIIRYERDYVRDLEAGTLDRSWVDKLLKSKGAID
jgi:RraA family protein